MYGVWCCTIGLEGSAIVPLYKEKWDRRDYRGIIILSISGKLYGMVLSSRVIESTKEHVAKEQGGFSCSRGCTDQIFL